MPDPRHLLRLPADGRRAGRHGGADRRRRVRRHGADLTRRNQVTGRQAAGSLLGRRCPERSQQVWMSHGDTCTARAARLHRHRADARRRRWPRPRTRTGGLYGMQFHPEVLHTEHGHGDAAPVPGRGRLPRRPGPRAASSTSRPSRIRAQVGRRPARSAGCPAAWTPRSRRRSSSGPSAHQLTCVFVDHGLLRTGRGRAGRAGLRRRDRGRAGGGRRRRPTFLAALAGVTDPEEKRKIIGREFIRAFEQAARADRHRRGRAAAGERGADFLVQGTLYPDVVESGGGTGTANIKSHHNVGGLPEDLGLRAGRAAARAVQGRGPPGRRRARACRAQIVWRQPFPGPGLAIRIVGEVTAGAAADRRGRPTPSPARS